MAAVIIAGMLLGRASVSADDTFEVPPPQPPAAVLPPSLVEGPDFKIVDPVASDGLMHLYVVHTGFGQFEAYGRTALEARIREAHALALISKTSKLEVVAGTVGDGVVSQVKTVANVAAHPGKTVTGVPRGIAHLFHGYVDRGQEALAEAKSASRPEAGRGATAAPAADKAEDAAKRYAKQYLGVTAAERHWYRHLGVDPYTDNAVLRDAIHREANLEAAASLGARFAGLPAIPGIAIVKTAEDAIYNEDPATVRKHNRETLAGFGLDGGEIARLENAPLLSPTRQVLLLEAAKGLDGVAGRAELFRHAFGLTSEAEAQVYLQSVGLLVLAHREQPVAEMLPGVRLPAGRRADGRVVVCGAFEAVYWTADVAQGEQQVRTALPQAGVAGRELWIAGRVSERARIELAQRGWTLEESVGAVLAEPASP